MSWYDSWKDDNSRFYSSTNLIEKGIKNESGGNLIVIAKTYN